MLAFIQVLEDLMERNDRRAVIVDVEKVEVLDRVMAQAQEVQSRTPIQSTL